MRNSPVKITKKARKAPKAAHLKDIDFRTREVRQKDAIKDFKKWYEDLSNRAYSDITQGQLSMLSAVLWYLLPKAEYKRLVTSKQDLGMTADEAQEQIAAELCWI